jgi:hypothetical protein
MADPAPTPEAASGATAEDLAVLAELAQVGLRLTQALERYVAASEQAQGEAAREDALCLILPPINFDEVATAFNRIARTVRMTLALKARLAKPRRAPVPDLASPARQAALAIAAGVTTGRCTPRHGAPRSDERENLFDTPDTAESLDQPMAEIVAQIAKDLGVGVDLSVFVDDDTGEPSAAARIRAPPLGELSGLQPARLPEGATGRAPSQKGAGTVRPADSKADSSPNGEQGEVSRPPYGFGATIPLAG